MFFSKAIAAALTVSACAAAPSPIPSDGYGDCADGLTTFCPSTCTPSLDQRTAYFKAFNDQLFSGDVAGAFATYVSPGLIEHTASASSYGADVGFLSLLFPTVTVSYISDLLGCFSDICTVHYKAIPNSAQSFIANTTVISDFYRYNGTCIVEHYDSTQTANQNTTNPNFPGN